MKKINEAFICVACGKAVSQASKTCRNHCPFCFASVHVDGAMPGDRSSRCHGTMYPIAYELKNDDVKILLECVKCNKKHRNKRADDDNISSLPEYVEKYKKFFV